MAIAEYFHPKAMTLKDFGEIHRRLDDAGQANNPHRIITPASVRTAN